MCRTSLQICPDCAQILISTEYRIQVHEAGQTTFVQARVSTVARHVVRSTVGGHHSVFQCICFTFPGIATLQQFAVCHPGEDGVVMR